MKFSYIEFSSFPHLSIRGTALFSITVKYHFEIDSNSHMKGRDGGEVELRAGISQIISNAPHCVSGLRWSLDRG